MDESEQITNGNRAEKSRLIAIAIGSRLTDDTDGWTQVAERIAALVPDFATLLRFIRREPALLSAYFAVEARIRRLIAGCAPAQRLLVGYAHDLAAARRPSIVEMTDDELLRVRLYELSLIAGAPEPSTISAAAEHLSLRTPDGISALAFMLLRTGRVSLDRLALQAIGGWPEDRRRVFFWRYLAFTFQRRLTAFADPAQIFRLVLDRQEKARVLRLQMPGQFAAAKRRGLEFLRPTVLRSGLPATSWFDISLSLPRLASITPVHSWTRLVRLTLSAIRAEEYLSRPGTIRLMTRRFGADGVLHLYKHYVVRSLFEQSLENGARSSKLILKNFAGRYPQVLSPRVLEKVEAFTVDRDTFIMLVNEYLLGGAPSSNGNRADSDIADIVAAAFETPVSVMRAVVECETGRRLMAALAQFKNKHDINLLRSIAFQGEAPACPAGLDGYLYELRNAFALELAIHVARRGGRLVNKAAQRRVFDKFFLREFEIDRLPPGRLEAARQHLRSRAVGRINALLEAQGGSQRLETQDLEALARDWRDAEPVVTLLARLSDPARRGGPSTEAARLVLHTAKAAAQRRFMAFKFDEASGQRQLHFLTEAQRTAWKTSRAMVRIGGAERPDNQPRLRELTLRLDANLGSLCANAPAEPARLPPALRAEMAELASEEIKANPTVIVERALAAHTAPESIPEFARACLLDTAAQLKGAILGGFNQRNAARIMRALVRIGFSDAYESDACQSVLTDLRAIEREIPKDLLDGEMISKGIVVTAFDCSPRLMMTIGDVVNTGSCLNYQCGSRINVLPAYVVDANIQALVSWQLKQAHFASVSDYKAVLNAFVAGRPATAAFNGDRLMFHFTFQEGESVAKIDTLCLGFAHLRQVVRLGSVRHGLSLRPGLLAERGYAQPHPLQPLMHANHADILRALSAELHAVERRPLKFPQSRNPDGVYCDALGSVQPLEYAVY
jgi:hypothetical protein